jgi:mRNA interferase MazF
MAGLVPAIYVFYFVQSNKTWMAGTKASEARPSFGRLRPTMTAEKEARYDPFDIVVVPFPYADRLAEKRRPALVISNRKLAVHGLVWVVMITSADNEAWSSDVAIADLKHAGLPAPSVVRPAKIACIEPGRIDRRIGRLDKAAAKAVSHKLRGFLGEG